jgi:drug/metabolite transporter (DMT)-like permease
MDRITAISERPRALIALGLAGGTWGLTLPLMALALRGVSPAWLVTLRFGSAALLLCPLAGRENVRRALRPHILAWGAFGYGAVVLLQSEAIERTSVSHAAVLGGLVPAVAVLIAATRSRRLPSTAVTVGLAGAIVGVALVAGGGGHAGFGGDGLVLIASLCSGAYIAAQPRLLAGRSPIAVTGVQMGAASLFSLPFALLGGSTPDPHGQALLALVALVIVGSLLPFTLYAWSQTRVPHEVASAFLNLEALVGGLIGIVAFHDPLGGTQALGIALLAGGIVLVAAKAPPMPAAPRLATAGDRILAAG